MTHAFFHAKSSARVFGGEPEAYLPIHQWMDEKKESVCDFRHRFFRHHAEGITECEQVFGVTILNSHGKHVPVRYIAEQHVMEDCGGRIPTLADWLRCIKPEPWMAMATNTRLGMGARGRDDDQH